ncbi:hypothetical protein BGX27_009317 [Mortierella sp. AM989]|nr:hypothetical protein BGX27_009317 [Mortierella sp. AM989]
MSLQVNFTTHGHDLKAAYEGILRPLDPKNGDNWVVFGYDKGTNDLKVLNQGNGGLEELQDEFVDGKIQYAFARVVDPYSQLNKFVFIAWCGDGVPESKKGLFNSHLADVSRFLSGFHLQINARCEADVTAALIMKRLDEGSGSKYSTHKENYQAERIQPLQSAYKRTEIPDISALQRNPTKPEPAPKYNIGGTKPLGLSSSSSVSSSSNPTKTQDRAWPPPASSSSSSSVPSPLASNAVPERSWKSSGGGSYSAGANSFNKVQPPSSLSSYGQSSAPEPVVNKAHQIRLEREAREKEERERIKREIAASEARQKQPETSSTASRLAEERRLQEEKEKEREREREQEPVRNVGFNRVREERLAREKEERERAEAEDAARAAREAARDREQSSIREQASAREDEQKRQIEQQQKREREAREEEERRTREQDDSRRRQEEEGDQRRQQEEDSQRRQQESKAKEDEAKRLRKQQEEEEERQRQYEEEQEERRRQEEIEEHERRLQQEVGAATAQSVALGAGALLASASQSGHSDSVSAIVVYDYEKTEENEMSLTEGEIIRHIEKLDEGWWSGESEDGTRSGLFPANYVEVIDSAQELAGAAEPAVIAAEQEHHYQEQEQEEAHEHYPAEQHHKAPAPVAHGNGQSAVALYEYQAGEPNEITFAEGETISAIDFVTDDWWSGTNTAGAKGLFPANYVELIS